jgi:hypothetical protein
MSIIEEMVGSTILVGTNTSIGIRLIAKTRSFLIKSSVGCSMMFL